MRSRDGNRSYLLQYSALILTTLLQADSYHIGYRATIKDALLVNETLSVSRTMTRCQGRIHPPLLLDRLHNETLQQLITNNRDAFDNYLRQYSLHVRSYEKTINSMSKIQTTLTFPTECFTVDFKGNLAKIALIK